jgi:solute:Na+ symporter, SSS family
MDSHHSLFILYYCASLNIACALTPQTILLFVASYFLLLILISRLTAKKDSNKTFYTGNRNSPWFVVAFGMIGASLSGVTFISVPGWVGASQFSYMQTVLGYLVGYSVIALVLMPLYYRLGLTTIYTWLDDRYGRASYTTGAWFFLISRMLGSAFRLYIVAEILQFTVFNALSVPFWVTVSGTLLLIMVYTGRGGIKTIVYTDTLQTLFMLLAVGFAIYSLRDAVLPEGVGLFQYIWDSPMSKTFFFDDFFADKRHFVKQFISGVFLAIAMTGLDQDMMQKNLTCRNIGDAQKNMFWFSLSLVFVNIMFLSLGILLVDYAAIQQLDVVGDKLFPTIALGTEWPALMGAIFVIGLIAAAYSSADSALTALTTSFCIDILGQRDFEASDAISVRKRVHWGMAIVMLLVIVISRPFVSPSIIQTIFEVAGYTYGPLLGLFGFGLISRRIVRDNIVPWIAIGTPILGFLLKTIFLSAFGYAFSFELLLINGLITAVGLWVFSTKP